MFRFYVLFFVLGIMSCNGGCNNSSGSGGSSGGAEISHEDFVPPAPKEHIGNNVDIDDVIRRNGGRIIKQACSIIPLRIVADALGKTTQEISLSNATPPTENPAQSACFFKWDDFDVPNAGIFIQMIRNPLEDEYPGEYPDYISKYVASYRTAGEQAVEAEPIIFKKLEGLGDDGSYSTESGKYYWRIGEKVSFLVALNTAHNPADQYRIATTIGRAMTESYIK